MVNGWDMVRYEDPTAVCKQSRRTIRFLCSCFIRIRNLPLSFLFLPDGVISAETDPLWDWTVLALLLSQNLLHLKGLVGRLENIH